MRLANYFFYYSYIGLVIVAGFWGAFIYPEFDYRLLFNLETNTLTDFQRINLLSQYRFLRAIELGFGVFAILFVKSIFSKKEFNRLFIFIMSAGVLARIMSIVMDGIPSGMMLFFLAFELVGVVVIIFYSRKLVIQNVIA
ncbi:MAG: DUF4345 domain-containing protein [Prolixibacteraceae bacterium]|nr:DUF4345 domain-containing protein [Prolixibacteraceae bacterium]